MIDRHPDWGPDRHNPESRRSHAALQAARDERLLSGEPPEDS